jgi:hypothetical protein
VWRANKRRNSPSPQRKSLASRQKNLFAFFKFYSRNVCYSIIDIQCTLFDDRVNPHKGINKPSYMMMNKYERGPDVCGKLKPGDEEIQHSHGDIDSPMEAN